MKKRLLPLITNLSAIDFVNISFAIFLSLICIIFNQRVWNWYILISANIFAITAIFTLAYLAKNSTQTKWQHLHFWYMVPAIFLTFKELYYLIRPIRQVDYDHLLIRADQFIFGTDLTVWLHNISHPVLTEILQISYATFFFLPILLAIDLIINNRQKAVEYAAFSVVLGFILSYIGYFFLPAVGPRFTLHDFSTTNTDLPGLFLTNYLREMVNSGESIPKGTLNPLLHVQRDVFPSGHTQMTLIVMYLSVKLKTKTKWFFIINGTLLIFSTMYLRYHYGVDVLAGILFMILTMVVSKRIFNWWMNKTGRETFNYEKH